MAFLAFNRLGLMSFDEIPARVKIKWVFEPSKKTGEFTSASIHNSVLSKPRTNPFFIH
jgi:hypothetical protein